MKREGYVRAMTGPVVQSAINFSEGRRAEVVDAIVAAARTVPGAVVADHSADKDHNRMVLTLLGDGVSVRAAALATARVAVREIDLRAHTGAHPRIGAVDVIPLVPVRGISMEECVALSLRIGEELARELGLPVYLYEHSADPSFPQALPEIRKGGFEGLFGRSLHARFGPEFPHPTAGAVVVGARDPLVAWNILLDSPDDSAARAIAASIRRDRGSNSVLDGVRALGLWLPSRRMAQVSMNLTKPAVTPLPSVFDWVRSASDQLGAQVVESEVVGLVSMASLGGEPPERVLWQRYRESQLMEYWLGSD